MSEGSVLPKRALSLAGWVWLFVFLLSAMVSFAGCRKGNDQAGSDHPLPIIETPLGVPMVRVPGGWFEMGSSAGDPNEQPVHRVWVDAFLMDLTEVTQEQFRKLQIPDPSHFKGPARPAEQVTMTEVVEFCNERSYAEGLQVAYVVDDRSSSWQLRPDADGYRLPTEAQWEYACRAGSTGERFYGQGRQKQLTQYAWFAENAAKQTHPVGRKKPNPWGLFDMYGNVAEWCNDYYKEDYYAGSPEHNPRGPSVAKLLVLRGGGWNSPAQQCRSSWRAGESPKFRDICFAKDTIGFRCVRPVLKDASPAKLVPGTP